MVNAETLEREKALFRYTTALEQGRFDILEEILEIARGDSILERQIMEINAALCLPQADAPAPTAAPDPWRQRIKSFLIALNSMRLMFRPSALAITASVVTIFTVIIVGLAMLGPGVGKIFSNVVMAYNPSGLPLNPVQSTRTVDSYAYQGNTNNAYPAPAQFQATSTAVQSTQTANRLIVRNANLIVQTSNTRQASQAVNDLIAEFAAEGAFVVSANETYSSSSAMPGINMALRVPVQRYTESINRLAGLGQVLSRKENAQDVTQDYVDTSARVEALQKSRARLLEIIREAKNTDDLLRAEQELSRREAELEVAKTRQQNLAKTAALSSISLELRPTITSQPVADNQWNPAATIHSAVTALLTNLRRFTDGLIYFVITTLPWLVVIALLIYGFYRLLRRWLRQ